MRFILFLLCLLSGFTGAAQDYKFFNLTSRDGLSQRTINTIVQDGDGYMWIGTDDGLNRYDGRSVSIFRNVRDDSSSLSSNGVETLFVDGSGQLWIGTVDGGLNLFNKSSETFTRFVKDNPDGASISNNTIYAIVAESDSLLWVGTADGLNLIHTRTHEVTMFMDEEGAADHTMPNDQVSCLLKTADNTLWIGTFTQGLYAYDGQSFVQHYDDQSYPEDIDRANRIRTLFEDSRGNLWVGKDGGYLTAYDRQKQQWIFYGNYLDDPNSLSSNRVTAIAEDEYGALWVGTNEGLNVFDYEEDQFKVILADDNDPNSLSANYILCIYVDGAGSVWIGTRTGGVSLFHGLANRFKHVKKEPGKFNSLASNLILCFYEDRQGRTWIGTAGEGIERYDPKTRTFEHFPAQQNLVHNNILCINGTPGKVWIGSWGNGLGQYDLETEQFLAPYNTDNSGLSQNDILCMEPDGNGNIWLGTFKGGLNRFNIDSGTFSVYDTEQGLISSRVIDLHLDNENQLWIATNRGLDQYNLNTGRHTYYSKEDGLSHDYIHCIHEDPDGNLWLGTKIGLTKFDVKNRTFSEYREKDGLAGDLIYGILGDDQGNLWISTTNGISKLYRDSVSAEGGPVFKNYSDLNGLQDNEFNQNAFYKSPDGQLYFGGINGYNHFYPHEIIKNKYIPPVRLSSFKIYGKPVALDTAIAEKEFISLSYKDNFFSFEFAALDFISPEQNLYSYKMEGLDENWSVPSTRNYANYTNLQGGDYIFRVRGSNSDGVWNNEGASLHIYIDPPFYQTTWFYITCVIVALLIVFLVIRLRVARLKRDKKKLEDTVELRTRELAEKNADIMASIEYAERIQKAILPERQKIFSQYNDAFIIYLPKDIVSGDFYWYGDVGDKQFIAAVDCTGHGVPGAFMSMIGNNLLNQIILEKDIHDPGEILEQLNKGVQYALKQGTDAQQSNDGMDVALCMIEKGKNQLSYAGAYRPLYFVRNGELIKYNGNKYPIGGTHMALDRSFTTQTMEFKEGDMFYIFSDGFPDQFGGPKGKKFMGKRFQRMILEHQYKPMQVQRTEFMEVLREWMIDFEQVDDILFIGLRY